MLDADLSVRRLMKPQPSPVDCQMLTVYNATIRRRCRAQATHVVIVDAGCWRAVCPDHGARQSNLGVAGRSFTITYDHDACPHIHMDLVPLLDDPDYDEAWHCIDCDETF